MTAAVARAPSLPAGDGHADFAQALLDPDHPVPEGLKAWNGSDPQVRFNVYRNNVVTSLVQALAETFPVVRAMVGDDFFNTLARHWVRTSPPRSSVLHDYGDEFPAFVARYSPAAGLPYLPDLARLERARVRSCHAADAEPLAAAAWASWLACPDALVGCRVHLHPSVGVLRSQHAVASLWAAHQGLLDIGRVDTAVPEAAVIVRQGDDVLVVPVPHATAHWIDRLAASWPLGTATEDAAATEAEDSRPFDLPSALQLLIRHGVITHCQPTVTLP